MLGPRRTRPSDVLYNVMLRILWIDTRAWAVGSPRRLIVPHHPAPGFGHDVAPSGAHDEGSNLELSERDRGATGGQTTRSDDSVQW